MIFHITTASLWAQAVESVEYEATSLATEGFIHCSAEGQVARVANAGFRGRPHLIVLHIDERLLNVPVKFENLEGGAELFPHIYGPLPITAVIQVSPLEPGATGEFEFGAAL